ncbi:MAG: hypothetical protein D6784_06215 [Chloroflexi bacterium]|nr:MAG: hypothetical protein D6784_06215 [Chloroflexota bacterium]
MTVDFIAFSLIIDDLVFPDGRTAMGLLGGGGPQAAFGMRLWADRVGLVAGVGPDLPPDALAWLAGMGIDTAGLRRHHVLPTPRAWQILEADGRRTQVWRTTGPALAAHLRRHQDDLPPDYRRARGVHLGVHPEEPDLDFIRGLRAQGMVVSVEPFRPALTRLSARRLSALVSAGQIFSPNLEEARSLVGPGDPPVLLNRLADAGASITALRLGPDGSLVHRAATGEMYPIPAYPVEAVDPTGAGNAYCGGFLAGWVQTGDLRLAGLYAAVSASFLVEQVGLPALRPDFQAEAHRRLARLRQIGHISPSR